MILGVMQGRLLPPVQNKIQQFPVKNWQQEFFLARELGLDGIEFVFDCENLEYHPLLTTKGREAIKDLVSQTSVSVLSICADYFIQHPLHQSKGHELRVHQEVLLKLIQAAQELSIKNIVLPCLDEARLMEDQSLWLLEAITPLLTEIQDAKIVISLETDLSSQKLLKLVQQFQSPWVKVTYDAGNSAAAGFDVHEEWSTYGSFISHVHLKDRRCQGVSMPIGEGDVRFEELFRQCKKLNFSGAFILQGARQQPGDEFKTIRQYQEFVKSCYESV